MINELHRSTPENIWESIINRLRMLRTEMLDLQKVIETIKTGEASLLESAEYIKKTMGDLTNDYDCLLSTFDSPLLKESYYINYADDIRHLCNIWEKMKMSPLLSKPDKQPESNSQAQTCQIKMLDTLFQDLIFKIGYLTIPSRLDDWLRGTRAGFYIPFHDAFQDEMPNFADRVKLLNILACTPEIVPNGLVDAETGLVYRRSPDLKSRWKSYSLVIFVALIAVALVAGSAYIPSSGWPLKQSDLAALFTGWGVLIIGVIVHIAISITKQQKAQKGHPPIMAISYLPVLIDVKAGQLSLKIILTLVGFFGLVFAAGIENAKPLNTFLVGYSLDSFVELFGASIEQKATMQLTALKQKLSTADKT